MHILYVIEGSLEVKIPTVWTDEKQRKESEKRREEERTSKKRRPQKKEDPGARKGRKVAKHSVSPMICGSGGLKSRLPKAAGAGRLLGNCCGRWLLVSVPARKAYLTQLRAERPGQVSPPLRSCRLLPLSLQAGGALGGNRGGQVEQARPTGSLDPVPGVSQLAR